MTSPRRLAWLAPAATVGVVAAVAALPATSATAAPNLPPRTAAELLVALQQVEVPGVVGTVREVADLGLPALPHSAGGNTGPASLLSGTHTLRVWSAGPDQQRIALLRDLAEYDVVHNGQQVWTYDSQSNSVGHLTLPAHSGDHPGAPVAAPTDLPFTPQQAAERVLAGVDPSTQVSVDNAVSVAGRPAYQLVLTPRDSGTLVGSVRLAVDSATSAPLRVQVFPRGASSPAFEVGFTDVQFTEPSADVFSFTPPAGASVNEVTLPTHAHAPTAMPGSAMPAASGPRPTVVGQGWTAITVLPAGTVNMTTLGQDTQSTLDAVTRAVPQGRILTTALASVLIANDGRVLVGAVPPAALQAAAG